MKDRLGFVSNSSSSSIIVKKEFLNDYNKQLIYNHIEMGKILKLDSAEIQWEWSIEETENGDLRLYHIIMDNFDMGEFLTLIHMPKESFYYE